MVDNTVKSGIKPITFDYRDVTFYQKDVHLARTFMVFHSLELGALTFDQYRFVARRTPQGEQVMKRHFERVIRLIPRLMERDNRVEYFIIPAIPKLVINGALVSILYGAFALYADTLPSTVCVEISADILFEDIEVVKVRLNELRELGVKIAISEVGDEFCPAFKLSELPFDLILLDKFTTERLSRPDAERILSGMIAYLHSFGVPVIAPDLETEEQISVAKTLECDGYSSIHADPLFPQEEPEPEIPEEPEEIPEEIEEPEEKTEEEPEEIPEELTVEVTEQAAEEIPAQPEEQTPEEPEEPEVYVTVFAGAFRRPEPGTRKGLDRTIGRTAPKRDCKRDIAKAESARKREEESKKLKRKSYVAYPALLPEWIAEEEPEEITETLTVETVEQAEEIPVQLEAIEIPEEPAEPKEEIPAEPEEEIPEEIEEDIPEEIEEDIPEEIEEDIPEEPEVYTVVFAGAFRRPEQGTRKGIDRTIGRTAPKRDGKREIGRGKTAPEPNTMRRRLKREP